MKDIYVIGSGGFAKEVFFLLQETKRYNVLGFVDINTELRSICIDSVHYQIFSEEEIKKDKNVSVAIGIGDPKIISRIVGKYASVFDFPNIIHPNVVGNWNSIKIGKGNIICSNVNFTLDIQIGSFNVFNLSATVGHDSRIGDCNVINPTACISGGVVINNNVLIGANSTILQYRKIGDNAIVGAGAVVLNDIPENETWVGNPAKKNERKSK